MTKNDNEHDNNELPLLWKKLQVLSQLLIAFAIPITGFVINMGLAQGELALKYVTLATEILEVEKVSERRELKKWAVNIVNSYMDEDKRMTQDVKREILGFYNPGAILFTKSPENRTDFDLFICEKESQETDTVDLSKAEEIANNLIEQFKNWKKGFGQLGYYYWDHNDQLSFEDIKGKATIILDKDHPEKVELKDIERLIRRADRNLEIQTKDNSSDPTPWRISIIVCPE